MNRVIVVIFFLLFAKILFSQELSPPAVRNNFASPTSYDELSNYLKQLEAGSKLLKVAVIGKSVQGRNLYGMMFSASEFGKDKKKIKVLIFAQQHGNEQSGKEGALLLAQRLLKPESAFLFKNMDLMLIPQLNPDGAELNTRRNANEADLNRNHMTLTEPETQALHKVFDQYLFEVSMDVHEYSPYGEDWVKFGYRKNADITIGATTNLGVGEAIRDLSNKDYIPYLLNYMKEKGFSSFVYCPGGPPGLDYFRHSTFDVNDGRQSLGIQQTFSFIQEGMNGKDTRIENLQHRAEGQMNGMLGLLDYVALHKDQIKKIVAAERKKVISEAPGQTLSLLSTHVRTGEALKIPLYSYKTTRDSVFVVSDYRPMVASLLDVEIPLGYLIPKALPELTEWVNRQQFKTASFPPAGKYVVEQYFVNTLDSVDFEGDIIVNPVVRSQEFKGSINEESYVFIPTNQLKGKMLALAVEPRSMLGLITYKKYAHLLKKDTFFPIFRVVKK